jgi:hypothetical protein
MARPVVRPDDWPDDWNAYQRWRARFHAALDPALHTPAWLDGEVACGRLALFTAADSAIIASVKTYPTGLKEVQGELAVGKRAEIVGSLIPRCERWAQATGCRSAQISSREGWTKIMRSHGYNTYQTTIRKAL